MKKHRLAASLSFAFQGLCWTIKQERNMQIHLGCTLLVMGSSLWLGVFLWEITTLAIVITLVLVLEMINTALEQVVNLCVGTDFHPLAKRAKDIAAGAVLIAAINAIMVGLLIFLPKLLLYR